MGSALLCAGSDGDGEGARGEVEGAGRRREVEGVVW